MADYYPSGSEDEIGEKYIREKASKFNITSKTTKSEIADIVTSENKRRQHLNSLKRKYKAHEKLRYAVIASKCEYMNELLEIIDKNVPPIPISKQVSRIIGNRITYVSVKEALKQYSDGDIIVAALNIFIKCKDVDDFYQLLDTLMSEKKDIYCKQLIKSSTPQKISFKVRSSDTNVAKLKEAFIMKFGKIWESLEITMNPYIKEGAFIVLENTLGTFHANKQKLASLYVYPPDGYQETVNDIVLPSESICDIDGKKVGYELPDSIQSVVPHHLNKLGMTVININIDNSININGDNNSINCIDVKNTIKSKKLSDKQYAKKWINKHNPTDKITVSVYYNNYAQYCSKKDKKCIKQTSFRELMIDSGFETKRVTIGTIWIRKDKQDSDSSSDSD